jgi:methanol---5-hydroxybenzimidazolylcobamide Co-methyltransferase
MPTNIPSLPSLENFLFGKAKNPVHCGNGLIIGGGEVYPEVNFTLPAIEICQKTMPEVRRQYQQMVQRVTNRAIELEVPGLVIEFETLPPMTIEPQWGLELSQIISDTLNEAHQKHGLKTGFRLTPNDTREFDRPPLMRQGKYWEKMIEFFEGAKAVGADMISIESTGGKEVSDEALVNADLNMIIFALGVLGSRDMDFLWKHIVEVCNRKGMVPAGDSACGFANTAMVLAEQKMIPRLFAALIRVAAVPRSLVAVTAGARGPSKDCAYEGPYLKALTGIPISMEGRSAACAHLSPIGNIAQAVCDLWSNESVQNVRLLSDYAPVVSVEQLAYDCRLMNVASKHNQAAILRDWLAESDAPLDPQAYVLRPDVVLRLSEKIGQETTPFAQTRAAVVAAFEEIKKAWEAGEVKVPKREESWFNLLENQIDDLADTEDELIEDVMSDKDVTEKFLPAEYGL